MRGILLSAATALSILSSSAANADTLLIGWDYDSPLYVAPGVSAFSNDVGFEEAGTVGPWNSAGWAGSHFVNRTTGDPAGLP